MCYTDDKDFQCCVNDSHLFCVSVSCVFYLICKSFSDSGVKDLHSHSIGMLTGKSSRSWYANFGRQVTSGNRSRHVLGYIAMKIGVGRGAKTACAGFCIFSRWSPAWNRLGEWNGQKTRMEHKTLVSELRCRWKNL